jgi:hypothetical protein
MDKIGEKMKVVFKLLLIMMWCNAFNVYGENSESMISSTKSVFSDTSLMKKDIKKPKEKDKKDIKEETTQTTPIDRGVINLGYPYIGLGYNYGNWLYGIRGAFGNEISVYAFRISIFENSNKKTLPYIGLELGGISFDTYSLEGNGVESGIFFGLEHYISKNISFSSEFYPVFITVKSGDYRVNRLEFVLNFGFNFYWRNR